MFKSSHKNPKKLLQSAIDFIGFAPITVVKVAWPVTPAVCERDLQIIGARTVKSPKVLSLLCIPRGVSYHFQLLSNLLQLFFRLLSAKLFNRSQQAWCSGCFSKYALNKHFRLSRSTAFDIADCTRPSDGRLVQIQTDGKERRGVAKKLKKWSW